jgi:4'-phosphopantetheinyl transferase
VIARGILRELLAGYTGRQPTEIEFQYGAQGKPALRAEDSPAPRICFNVSHSHGLSVYAFALDRRLGIDIELIRSDFGGTEIAERYFSPDEVAELNALPPQMRAKAFFLCWTRKEAYLKARGEGLQIPLASFSVSLTPGSREELRAQDRGRWELGAFDPGAGYAGALVAEGQQPSLRFYDWTSS